MSSNEPVDPDFEDEFADDAFDQDASLDGDFDDAEIYDEENEMAGALPPVKKKKSSLFGVLVIIGAIVVGVAILGLNFVGAKKHPPAVPPAQTAANAPDGNTLAAMQDKPDTATDTAPVQPVAPDQAASKGFMDNPSELKETTPPGLPDSGPSMTGFGDTSPTPAPSETTLAQGAPDSSPHLTPSESSLQAPQQNLPSIDQIKKAASPALTAPPAATLPTASAPVTAAIASVQPAGPSANEIALQSKLDDATSRITALEKQLADKPVPAMTTSGNDDAKIAELNKTIEHLQNKVSDLSAKAATPSSYSEEPVARPVVKKSPPRRSKPPVSSMPETTASSFSPSKGGVWELRGARPGEAMVGKAGEAGLQVVHVGDTISGIGQVKAINRVGNSWIVQGTSGTISQ